MPVPETVVIDDAPFKFILAYITDETGAQRYVVRAKSSNHCPFHVHILRALKKEEGVVEAECEGGGRLDIDHDKKVVTVSGESTQFGAADPVILEQTLNEGLPGYRVDVS